MLEGGGFLGRSSARGPRANAGSFGLQRGKALLALLEGNQDEAVTQALAAVKAGQYQRALALLKPYLEARGMGEEAARRG